ncbi:MAG: LysM peptidoglycan-binding domain-containing protein [Myxococcaceae bacterium]
MRILLPLVVCALFTGASTACNDSANASTELSYRVRVGDTLSGIAYYFEVPGGFQRLAARNRLADPDYLRPEMTIIIPVDHLLARGEDPSSRIPAVVRHTAPTETPCPVEGPLRIARVPLDVFCDWNTEDRCDGVIEGADPRAVCTAFAGGYLCQWSSHSETSWERALPKKAMLRSTVAVSPEDDGELEAVSIDLDGDGAREVVLKEYLGTANGLALSSFAVRIHDGRTNNWARITTQEKLAFASTDGAHCELRVTDFDYARDLESGARHGYLIDYRHQWNGVDLVPLNGASFERIDATLPGEFRLQTPRTRVSADTDRKGVILEVKREDPLELRVQLPEGTETISLNWATISLPGIPAGLPGDYTRSRGFAEFVGRGFTLDEYGNVWME